MTKQEHLLVIIAEECAEIAKCAAKALRFGRYDTEPGQDENNEERILEEFNDLVAVIEMAYGCPIAELISQGQIADKKRKVNRYLEYSKECKTLTEE